MNSNDSQEGIKMQQGSENFQLKDSYFVVIHPNTYVVIGISILLIVITLFISKKIIRRK